MILENLGKMILGKLDINTVKEFIYFLKKHNKSSKETLGKSIPVLSTTTNTT